MIDFQVLTKQMIYIKEEWEEFATCLCMIFGPACLFVGLFFVVGLMAAAMTISSALPLHIFGAIHIDQFSIGCKK